MATDRQNTRRIVRTFLRPWWRRPLALVAGFVLALVGGRIALEPWLTAKVRADLARVQTGGVVTFRDLDVSVFPPSVVFNDLAFRGRSGESLDVDRLVIDLRSLRELVATIPHVRVKLLRPHLRTTPDSRDLDQLVRALPAARVDVASVSNGSVSQSVGGDGRPVLDGVSGAVEGLATGTEVGRVGWKFSADGHMVDLKPTRLAVTFAPGGTWEMAMTVRASGAASPNGQPFDIAALVNGVGARVKAKVHVAWLGATAPAVLAGDTVSSLSDKWPTAGLVLREARQDPANAGQALDLVIQQGSGKAVAREFHPRDAIGVAVDVVRLGSEVLMPASEGLATPVGDTPTHLGTTVATDLEDDHDAH